MGYSMRFEHTRLNDFQLLIGLYSGHPLFFLEHVYLSLLYPSLIIDMFLTLSVCVCVCWSGFGFHEQLFFLCVCMSVHLGDILCLYVR